MEHTDIHYTTLFCLLSHLNSVNRLANVWQTAAAAAETKSQRTMKLADCRLSWLDGRRWIAWLWICVTTSRPYTHTHSHWNTYLKLNKLQVEFKWPIMTVWHILILNKYLLSNKCLLFFFLFLFCWWWCCLRTPPPLPGCFHSLLCVICMPTIS